jgi:signal transduction histidine kinase
MNAELVVQAIAEIGRCDEKALPQALQQLASSLSYKHAAIVQAKRAGDGWLPERTVCQSQEFQRACKAVVRLVCASKDPVCTFSTATGAIDFTKSIEETATYAAAGIHLEEHCGPDAKTVLMLVSDAPGTTLSEMEKRLLSTVGTLVSKVLAQKAEPTPEEELSDPSTEIGMVSHDLRNPIGTILGYTELLLQSKGGDQLQDDQRQALGKIRDNSLFVLNMLGELMDSAMIDSGKVRMEVFPCDIAGPIKQSAERCRMAASKKQIAIATELPAEPLRTEVDHGKIGRVLDNLLTNAIKFSKQGTTITVTAAREGDEVRVSVRDQGQGIVPDELPLLFKKFSRTSTRSTAGEKSSGLGLYIVKSLVKLHGGTVRADSDWGKGSTFSFALPIKE